MTETLFGDQPVDDNKNYLSELVGPGKKYADHEALAKAYWHADNTIQIANRRYDELRSDYMAKDAELKANKRFEELVDQLDKRSMQPPVTSELPPAKDRETPTFDPAMIDAKVSESVQKIRQQEKDAQNLNIVMGKLKERYGSNFATVLKEQTESLGLTESDVNALAKKSPQAFFKTMGLDQQMPTQTFDAPPKSQSTTFKPQGEKKRDWNYWQEYKKNNPQEYRSSRVQNQMLRDYEELGKDFETGDFKRYGDGI